MYYWHQMDSPVGPLLLGGDGQQLTRIEFQRGPSARPIEATWVADPAPFERAVAQLGEYFNGKRRAFDLPLAPAGTEFQRAVWQALRAIPYGATLSYGALAARLGRPQAARAVGLANGANPLPIVVPCHRVIGANGALVGFGGGLPIKRQLLQLERETLERHGGAPAR